MTQPAKLASTSSTPSTSTRKLVSSKALGGERPGAIGEGRDRRRAASDNGLSACRRRTPMARPHSRTLERLDHLTRDRLRIGAVAGIVGRLPATGLARAAPRPRAPPSSSNLIAAKPTLGRNRSTRQVTNRPTSGPCPVRSPLVMSAWLVSGPFLKKLREDVASRARMAEAGNRQGAGMKGGRQCAPRRQP